MHFDTGAQFECTEPIPVRIARKDWRNECPFYAFRMTIEKDTAPTAASVAPAPTQPEFAAVRPSTGRQAFEDLFKK